MIVCRSVATPERQRLLESASRFADEVFARTLGGLDPSQREELCGLLDLVLARPLDEDAGA